MRSALFIIFLILTLCGCVHFDSWTKTDKILEVSYLALHTVDWLQTRSTNWEETGISEKNPILGKTPSKSTVDLYMLTTGLLHPIVTHVLPQKYRKYWQVLTISIEAGTVTNNFSVGMKIRF